MLVLAELDFSQTVVVNTLDALATAAFTALLVVGGAQVVVKGHEERQKTAAREKARDAADARREAEGRAADARREADMAQEARLQASQFEHETRAALRDTYAELLVVQRRSREASVALANAGGQAADPALGTAATQAHGAFIDQYHRLNLDVDRAMWEDARGLRDVLDKLLDAARIGDQARCRELVALARDARQNLERSFRIRLGLEPLQERQGLGAFDKGGR